MHPDTPWSSAIRLSSVPGSLVDAMQRLSYSLRRRLIRPQGTYQDRLYFYWSHTGYCPSRLDNAGVVLLFMHRSFRFLQTLRPCLLVWFSALLISACRIG